MNLSELVKSVGPEAFSKAVGVSISTARSYRYMQRSPRGPVARKILSVYGDRITYFDIYGKPE